MEPVLCIPWVPKFDISQLKFTLHFYRKTTAKNLKKLLFLTQPGVLWKIYCPFKLERGKILGMQTGVFSMCPDFFWNLAVKSPTKTFMPPRNLRKIQGKEGSCLLLKKRRVVLPQSVCSTCQNCLPQVLCLLGTSKRSVIVLYHHSEMPLKAFFLLFLNRHHFRHLNQFPCCGFSPSGQSIPISVLIILITKVPQVLLSLLCLGVC